MKGSISVLNLMEVVTENGDPTKGCNYFRTLCQQSFPGPLVCGSVGSKELNKWTDERIANCESPDMDSRKGEVLRLLVSLLKIACQHYGKFRSPFGTETMVGVLIMFFHLVHCQLSYSFDTLSKLTWLYSSFKSKLVTLLSFSPNMCNFIGFLKYIGTSVDCLHSTLKSMCYLFTHISCL